MLRARMTEIAVLAMAGLAARYAAGRWCADRVSYLVRADGTRLLFDTGMPGARARRTFSFAAEPFDPRGMAACMPTEMRHDRASVVRTVGPGVVAPGVAKHA